MKSQTGNTLFFVVLLWAALLICWQSWIDAIRSASRESFDAVPLSRRLFTNFVACVLFTQSKEQKHWRTVLQTIYQNETHPQNKRTDVVGFSFNLLTLQHATYCARIGCSVALSLARGLFLGFCIFAFRSLFGLFCERRELCVLDIYRKAGNKKHEYLSQRCSPKEIPTQHATSWLPDKGRNAFCCNLSPENGQKPLSIVIVGFPKDRYKTKRTTAQSNAHFDRRTTHAGVVWVLESTREQSVDLLLMGCPGPSQFIANVW